MSHIFISYSRKDTKVVEQFVESLRKQDFIVWQDVSNISAGDQWHQALMDAIDQAAVVVVFWSQAASLSKYVNEELDRALARGKRIIPVWLDKNTPLRIDISSANAIDSKGFSVSATQRIVGVVLETAPRIQRLVTSFDPTLPINTKKIKGTTRSMIGSKEYIIVPLIQSLYSSAFVIAEPGTIVRQAKRIQLIVQNTGPVDYTSVRDAFKTILTEDAQYPEEAEALVGLYVTGAVNPQKKTDYWVDNANVAHYSDMIDTLHKAINHIAKNALQAQTFQLFQKTLVEIAFLVGVQMDRWIPLQLYKWDGQQYVRVMNIPPRSPN